MACVCVVYIHMYVHARTRVYRYAHPCMHVWRPEVNVGCLALLFSALPLETGAPSGPVSA